MQEEKNGNVCILMWVLGGSKRGGKRQDTEREEKERGMKKEWKENGGGRKHIKDTEKRQDGMIRCSFESMFTGINSAIGRWSIPAGCAYHVSYSH